MLYIQKSFQRRFRAIPVSNVSGSFLHTSYDTTYTIFSFIVLLIQHYNMLQIFSNMNGTRLVLSNKQLVTILILIFLLVSMKKIRTFLN